MKIRNFSLILDGNWQDLSDYEAFFMGLQIRNPAGNDTVEFRWGASDVALNLLADETYEAIAPKPEASPIQNEIQIKGTAAQVVVGERWLYDHQTPVGE